MTQQDFDTMALYMAVNDNKSKEHGKIFLYLKGVADKHELKFAKTYDMYDRHIGMLKAISMTKKGE